MKNQSLYDKIAKGLGDAIADIREKVVEEPWYGRVVNERHEPEVELNFGWPPARAVQPDAVEHEHDGAVDMDMDR